MYFSGVSNVVYSLLTIKDEENCQVVPSLEDSSVLNMVATTYDSLKQRQLQKCY